ncbi:uncharacterized protein LOC114774578 [Denticeps clupeoides]|uniref:uncharacterized protein LOC114774578 n=1 Tax=Denticeps clupeoides TaxID=299321 RepID=UPI0010A2E221|nr:uncharacterized protein LOC114774578 [Denticeps clupeoides]XP_028822202.1 uncharacterized protein LOC114774578 [Denticeps clupeoides]
MALDRMPGGPEELSACRRDAITAHADGDFGDWSDFSGKLGWEGDGDAPDLPAESRDERSHGTLFQECFRAQDVAEDRDGAATLSEILENRAAATPLPPAVSSGAAELWCHLLSAPHTPRLSGPKPNPHSHTRLLRTLPLDEAATSEGVTLPEMDLEENEDAPPALIQTKLLAPPRCRDAPPFLYQVSLQWLRQSGIHRNLLR